MPGHPTRLDGIFLPLLGGVLIRWVVFRQCSKTDGDETQRGYSVSAWWLEPRTTGPGAHVHAKDGLFYVK